MHKNTCSVFSTLAILVITGCLFIALRASPVFAEVCANVPTSGTDFELATFYVNPQSVIRGSYTVAQFVIVNCGPETIATQANFEIYVVDSFDNIVPNSPVWGLGQSTKALTRGEADTPKVTITIPSTMSLGDYRLKARIYAGVNDFNANNNILYADISITPGCLLAPGIAAGVVVGEVNATGGTCPTTEDTPPPSPAPPSSQTSTSTIIVPGESWPKPALPNITKRSSTSVQLNWPDIIITPAETIYYHSVTGNPQWKVTRRLLTYLVAWKQDGSVGGWLTGGTSGTTSQVNIDNLNATAAYWFSIEAVYERAIYYVGPTGAWVMSSITCGITGPLHPATPAEYITCAGSGLTTPVYFKMNRPPSPVSYLVPTDNSRGVAPNTSLSYIATDPDSNTVTYDVYVGTSRTAVANEQAAKTTTTNSSIAANSVVGALQACTTYYWKVVARDPYAQKSVGSVKSFVTAGCQPTASIEADETRGRYPLTVDLRANAEAEPGAVIMTYAWNFGDGISSTQQDVTHTYTAPGVYTVSLAITDSRGLSTTATPIAITANFTAGPESPLSNGTYLDDSPAIAYDSTRSTTSPDGSIAEYSRFLMAWRELQAGPLTTDPAYHRIKTSIVETYKDTSNETAIRVLSTSQLIQNQESLPGREGSLYGGLAVAYSTVADKYLVVWSEVPPGPANSAFSTTFQDVVLNIRGIFVNANGTASGSSFLIEQGRLSGPFLAVFYPRIASGTMSGENGFLIAWAKRECVTTPCQQGSGARFVTTTGAVRPLIPLPFVGRMGIIFDGSQFVLAGQKSGACTNANCSNLSSPIIAAFVDQNGSVGPEINVLSARPYTTGSGSSTAIAYDNAHSQYFVVSGGGWYPCIQGARFTGYVSFTYYPPETTIPCAVVSPRYTVSPAISFDGLHFMIVWARGINDPTTQWRIEGVRMRWDGSTLDSTPIPISTTDTAELYPGSPQGSALSDAGDGVYNMLVAWPDKRTPPRIWGVVTHAATPVYQVFVPPVAPPIQPIPGIDLVTNGFSMTPTVLKSGVPISANSAVRNDGTQATGAFQVGFYWSATLPASSGEQIYVQNFSNLGAGSVISGPFTVTPPTSPDGTYYLTMDIDPRTGGATGQVVEANEYNNVVALAVTIDNAPPVVSLSYPTAGLTVGGLVPIMVTASDATEITNTELYVDGVQMPPTVSAGGWVWDSQNAPTGTHTIYVKAYDAAGNVGTSSTVTIQVDNVVPVISNVVAGTLTTSSATITWTTNEGSDTQVEYGTTGYGSSTTLNTNLVTSHSMPISGLSASTLYHYRVKSRDAAGNLAVSGDYTFTTAAPPDTVAPGGTVTINAGAAATNSTAATLTLTCTDNVACTQMQIAPDGTANTEPWVAYATSANTTLPTGNGTKTVAVKFRDATNNTSAQVTDTIILDTTVPGTPASLTPTVASSSQINLSWPTVTDSGGSGLATYRIERCQGSGCSSFSEINSVTAPTTTFNNTGLAAGTTYRYRVRARDGANNNGGYSLIATATTSAGDTTPPVISGTSAGTVTFSGATITWTTNEAADTQIEYGLTTSYGTLSVPNPALVTSHSQPLGNLAASTTYHYRVKSRDAAGNQATSADATFTTGAVTGRLAWYRMEETGTITSIADSSGNNRTATNAGAVSATGRIGNGFSFNGTNAAILFPSIVLSNTFSVSMWLYTTGADTYANLFSQNGDIGLQYKGYQDRLTFWYNTADHLNNTLISRNQWHHIVLVNNAGAVTFYLDGVANGTATGAPGFTASHMGDDVYSENYAGTIDEVKVYNRALTATEVASEARYYSDTTPPTLPTGLNATAVGSARIDLSWTASTDTGGAGLADYRIERCAGGSCTTFTEIAAATAPTTSYTNTGLSPSTTYRYRVRVRDAANNYSPYATIVSATTAAGAGGVSLKAWYQMEETGAVTTIADSSGGGLTATNAGATSTTGRIGNGLAFNGTTSRVDLPFISLSNTFTVMMWIYTTGSDMYGNLFSQNGDIGLQYKGDVDKLTFWYDTTNHLSNTSISRNQWHHIALVNNAGAVTFYLDGVPDGTATGGPGFTASRMGDDAYSENYAGRIDEVKVYNRALSQTEIQASMTGLP